MTEYLPLKLELLGVFSLVKADGTRIAAPSKRAIALIAMLATADRGERSRRWLQDRLWGGRATASAQGGLRREISNLRRHLNIWDAAILSTTQDVVRLDLSKLRVDVRELDRIAGTPSGTAGMSRGEFLEGFDIAGEDELEEWLRQERSRIARLRHEARSKDKLDSLPALNRGAPRTSLVAGVAVTDFCPNQVTDPVMRLRLFGVMEALSFSGEGILPRSRKSQAILAYLALSSDGDVPRRRLVDLLWSTRNVEQGRASLRQSLCEIRAALRPAHESIVCVERDRIRLDRERVWIDGISQRADAEPARSGLDRALFVGRLMETVAGLDPKFDEWIVSIRHQVDVYLKANHHSPSAADDTASPAGSQNAGGRRSSALPGDAARGLEVSVMPFIPIGSRELDNLAHFALTQEIVTTLARCRWLQVRLNTPSTRSESQYRLEGYVSRAQHKCRIAIRLIDQTNRDLVVWTTAVHAPYPLEHATIAEVTERIVEQLDPEILAIETRKALRRPSVSQDSYQCILRAIPLIYSFEIDAWRQATQLLQQATEIDPQHGRAFAFSALCRLTGLAQGWSENPQRDLRVVDTEAARGVACDPHDSLALALSAHIQSFVHHDFDGALSLYDRAIRSNPSCGFAWGYSSLTFAYLGRPDEASRRLARAQAIMIHDPFCSIVDSFNAVISYFRHDWTTTIALCRHHLERRPTLHNIRKLLIGALCFQNKLVDARHEAQTLSKLEPQFSWSQYLQTYPFGQSQDRLALEAVLSQARFIPDRKIARSKNSRARSNEPIRSYGD